MQITSIGGGGKLPALRATLDRLPTSHSDVLLVPTAASFQSKYDRVVDANVQMFDQLGVRSRVLHEFNGTPSADKIAHEIGSAALVYTLGGNSPRLFRLMGEWGLDQQLIAAVKAGKPHAGVSAGAALLFETIHSNPSAKPDQEEWDFSFLPGLGVIPGVIGVHADNHDKTINGPRPDTRLEHLVAHLPVSADHGIAIDNYAAVILGDHPEIIRANPDARVHLITRDAADEVITTPVEDAEQLRSIV